MINKELLPFSSVIILNYYGERIIANTIDSLMRMNYPKDRFEVIIVDNNSQDRSKEIINHLVEKYKNIRAVFLDKNLGFSRGNNVGIKLSKGEYIALLNNDCIVNKNWLLELVKTAIKDKKIFAVNSKIFLYPKYLETKIKFDSNLIFSEVGLTKSNLLSVQGLKKFILLTTFDENKCIAEIPFDPTKDDKIEIKLKFEVIDKSELKSRTPVQFYDLPQSCVKIIKKKIIKDSLVLDIQILLSSEVLSKSYEKIQNAGIIMFQDGSGRDIGAVISYQRQNYEKEIGQYNTEREVYAACGAASLYNKKILDKIGYLDESFFMYYEDVEISERARLHGYKIIFCPKAIVRHFHALSSKEWSNFFIYNVQKGRLMHLFYHFPTIIFIKEYLKISLNIGEIGLRIIIGLTDRKRVIKYMKNFIAMMFGTPGEPGVDMTDLGKAIQYIKIFSFFPLNIFKLFLHKLIKHQGILKTSVADNYRSILEGKWYFK